MHQSGLNGVVGSATHNMLTAFKAMGQSQAPSRVVLTTTDKSHLDQKAQWKNLEQLVAMVLTQFTTPVIILFHFQLWGGKRTYKVRLIGFYLFKK